MGKGGDECIQTKGEREEEEGNEFGSDASSAWQGARVRVSGIVAFPSNFCADEGISPLRRARDFPWGGKIFLFPAPR